MLVVRAALLILTTVLVIVTVLPLSGSHAWWVRMWDFPRVQLAAINVAVLVGVVITLVGYERLACALLLMACIAYQSYRIFPYTPFATPELHLAANADCDRVISLLAANVLMENTDYAALIQEIDDVDPDVLFLMETDDAWTKAMEPVLARYDTVLREPKDNHYGLIFATRLRTRRANIVYLVDDDTPAVYAELLSDTDEIFRYIGLHPRPPLPGSDTEERDAQILFAARFARETAIPLVAMGDFNDAAWSDTAHLFKTVGEYLDPRVGRGMVASFDARSKLMRVPIDHLYVTSDVAIASFSRGNFFGSDHFPMIARVCIDAPLAATLNKTPPALTEKERQRAEEIVTTRTTTRRIKLK